MHALGNGRLLAYARGADVTHLFGPVYSTASLLTATWSTGSGAALLAESDREPGAGIWSHRLTDSGQRDVAGVTAVVDPEHTVLAWRLEAAVTVRLLLAASRPGAWTAVPEGGRAELATRPGAPVFVYPDPSAPAAVLRVDDPVVLRADGDRLLAEFAPGSYDVFLGVGADPAEAGRAADAAGSFEAVTEGRRQQDQTVAGPLKATADRWRQVPTWGAEAAGRLEGAAFALLAQQSADGGLMAGYPYPLAYGRDQYGACRGLAAVGLVDEAKRNFLFRHEKLRRFGRLANAESMGHDRVRHRHENDDVELTSYHVLHAVELAEDPRVRLDLAPLREDLLECLVVQLEHLRSGMLPFNGDETYVAGGILPRTTLEDGSLESTLLFVEAARRLRPYVPSPDRHALRVWSAADEVAATWRQRFGWAPGLGGFATNAPQRRSDPPIRTVRSGVCESCGRIGPDPKTRTAQGRYVCASCLADGRGEQLPAVPLRRYSLLSAALLPFLVDPELLRPEERRRLCDEAFGSFDDAGQLRTLASSPRSVGYDGGLLLLASLAGTAAQRDAAAAYLLGLFDEADTLAEYYLDGAPDGTRCRPWETGVALAALDRASRAR